MGKRLTLILLALLVAAPLAHANLGRSGLGTPPPFALEEDGSPSGIFTKIIFGDDSLSFDGTHVHVTTVPSDALDLAYLRLDFENADSAPTGTGFFKVSDSETRFYVEGIHIHTWEVTGVNFVFVDGNNFTFVDGNNFIFN